MLEENSQEKEPTKRAGVAHLEKTERVVKEVVGVEEGGIDRPALSHDKCLGEDLQGSDQTHDEVEKNVGSEQRQGDVCESVARHWRHRVRRLRSRSALIPFNPASQTIIPPPRTKVPSG